MNTRLYLFLTHDPAASSVSWVTFDAEQRATFARGALHDVAAVATLKHVYLVLPGENVVFLRASVPGTNREKILQALPYVLEESVIDDVETLHFSLGHENAEGEYEVAVINADYLKDILDRMQEAGIEAFSVIADYMLLAENNILLVEHQRVLFKHSHAAFAVNGENCEWLLDTILSADEQIKLVHCVQSLPQAQAEVLPEESRQETAQEDLTALNHIIEKYKVETHVCKQPAPLYLVSNIRQATDKNTIELLQGAFAKKKNWSKAGKTWWPVAAMFLFWLSLQGGLVIQDYFSLNAKNTALQIEVVKIYKKTFPKSRHIVGAEKKLMQQKLQVLRKRHGQASSGFSEMLSSSAQALSKTPGVIIKSLRYFNGRINLELVLANLQALDGLKKRLQEQQGWQVEIQNASSGKDNVVARLQIIGAKV